MVTPPGDNLAFEPVAEMLGRNAAVVPSTVFIDASGTRLTYAEADEGAWLVANGLRARGFPAGGRVAYLSNFRCEVAALFFGVSRAGGVNVPLNVFLRGEFLVHQLVDSASDTVVVDRDGWDQLVPVLGQLAELRLVVLLDGVPEGAQGAVPPGAETLTFKALCSAGTAPTGAVRRPGDPFGFVYTSGTTGMPKACVLSEAYAWRTAVVHTEAWQVRRGDVLFTASPMYHISGYLGLLTAVHNEGTFVNDAPFSASDYLSRAISVEATISYGVAFHALALLGRPPGPADREHRLRLGFYGPLEADLRERFEERFGFEVLSEFYAQSECSMIAHRRLGGGVRRTGVCGTAASDIELSVVDEDDNPVPDGEVGEIVVRPLRPGALFSGYWRRGDVTAVSWRNLWHHTGDTGRLDESGVLTFVDRKVDSIRRRGEMVSAFEVERALRRHPAVAEAAVHGVSLESEVDQLIKAWIVPESGRRIGADDLAAFLAENVPYYASPRFVEITGSLPKNASGRVMKQELRQQPLSADGWDLEAMGLGVHRSRRRGVHSPPGWVDTTSLRLITAR